MGNSLLRENRWQQNTQETPWNLRNQSPRQGASRKKMHIFKARQDSPKQSQETSSSPFQENVDQNSSEDLCYTLIDHSTPGRRPSGNPAEECYENVSLKAERPRKSLGGTETEYSLLCVSSTSGHPSSSENEYELLMPSRIFSHSLQQSHPLKHSSQSRFSDLK
uniref:Germinal center associated signaling and motility n=1 Tax=Catagonus wagneri TaxID=51154 RepID=A0A8C3X8T8_9CETA